MSSKCQICYGQHLTKDHDIATGNLKEPEYERYGEEWEKSMMAHKKAELISMLREAWKRSLRLRSIQIEKDWYAHECETIIYELADIAGIPKDPFPGWQPCVAEIRSRLSTVCTGTTTQKDENP